MHACLRRGNVHSHLGAPTSVCTHICTDFLPIRGNRTANSLAAFNAVRIVCSGTQHWHMLSGCNNRAYTGSDGRIRLTRRACSPTGLSNACVSLRCKNSSDGTYESMPACVYTCLGSPCAVHMSKKCSIVSHHAIAGITDAASPTVEQGNVMRCCKAYCLHHWRGNPSFGARLQSSQSRRHQPSPSQHGRDKMNATSPARASTAAIKEIQGRRCEGRLQPGSGARPTSRPKPRQTHQGVAPRCGRCRRAVHDLAAADALHLRQHVEGVCRGQVKQQPSINAELKSHARARTHGQWHTQLQAPPPSANGVSQSRQPWPPRRRRAWGSAPRTRIQRPALRRRCPTRWLDLGKAVVLHSVS